MIDKRIPDTLERLNDSQPDGSFERQALSTAGAAYLFAMMYHRREFTEFFETLNDPLTEEQKAHLRMMGVEMPEAG